MQPLGRLCYKARRSARRAVDQIRVRDQSQTAKTLGLALFDRLLALADEVIE
jgi:hypothetical protein